MYKHAYFVNVVNVCTQSYKSDKPNTTKSCQRCTRLYTNIETQRVIHIYLYYIYILMSIIFFYFVDNVDNPIPERAKVSTKTVDTLLTTLTNQYICTMPRIDIRKRKRTNQDRPNKESRYHTTRWRKARILQLMREPLCRICMEADRVTAAEMVDHIKPVRLGGGFWDESNYQSLCNSCHAVKSAKERGLTPGAGILDE